MEYFVSNFKVCSICFNDYFNDLIINWGHGGFFINNSFVDNMPIQLFSKTRDVGINLIQNPNKLEIISYLLSSDLSFSELLDLTGKSKSVLSFHLNALVDLGIIDFRVDSDDRRKKIFFMSSKFLGEVNPSNSAELEEFKTSYIIDDILNGDKFKLSTLLFHNLRFLLIQDGININPILEETGKRVGFDVYDKVYDDDFYKFIKNVENLWTNSGIGTLEIMIGDVIQINAFDCFECALLPKQDDGSCFIDKGILWALFSQYFGFEVIVEESKCYSLGDDCCSFSVKVTNEVFKLEE